MRMRPPLGDTALAAVLCAARLATLALGTQPGGGAVSYLATPFLTLPLAWRSSRPLAVAAIVFAANALEVGASGYHDSVVLLAVFVLVPYSLAAHAADPVRMVAGLALVFASGAVSQTAQGPVTLSTVAGDAAVVLVPFFAGFAMRQQRLRAAALERLAEQLERERDERARSAVAEERARIARELHDEIAHAMSVIAVQADAAEGALENRPELVRSPLLAIRETARDALRDMRRVVGALQPDEAPLAPEPGLARASALVEQVRASGLEVELRVEGEPVPLPPLLDLAAFRVLQEGLTNVRKHAAAGRAEVVVRYRPGAVDVEVTDDGDGSGPGGGTGCGLAGIRERVGVLGGRFVAGPSARGFVLSVTLPLA